jgi:hypothetical protein
VVVALLPGEMGEEEDGGWRSRDGIPLGRRARAGARERAPTGVSGDQPRGSSRPAGIPGSARGCEIEAAGMAGRRAARAAE